MARQKKTFTYEFADGPQVIPASYKAKCTITGEFVPMYHKFLNKLIQKKYKNNFSLFVKTFATKGAIKQKRVTDGYGEEDPFRLNAYSDYLIASYRHCLNVLEDNYNREAINKTKNEMEHIRDCFTRRFNRDISKYI